ncbi:hypothetical protein SNEBB_011445 [Seison nebaliae]|nr:hypothetical protein SNEBB_011445 [Seison nebaliae]
MPQKSDKLLESYKPDPPTVGKVTHHTVQLAWNMPKGVKDSSLKSTLQEFDSGSGKWINAYIGLGNESTVTSLESNTAYKFRLQFAIGHMVSQASVPITVTTTNQPLSGDNLHKAILLGNVQEVQRILESPNGNQVKEIEDKFGHSPLMQAVQKANIDVTELLIEHDVEIDYQNESGKTAFMIACFNGTLDIMKCLRYSGASLTITDASGSSPLHYSVDSNKVEAIQWLIMEGSPINAVDTSSEWTPLMRCANLGGNVDVARTLIRNGCDINLQDKEGKTPLAVAVINGYAPLVELLLNSNADANCQTKGGKTAYELAQGLERRNVILILEHFMEEKAKEGKK